MGGADKFDGIDPPPHARKEAFMRKLMFALAAQALAVGALSAQSRPLVAPIVPCPPVTVPCQPGTVMPGSPVVPYNPSGTPEVPNNPPGTTPPGTTQPGSDMGGGFARQSEGGTQVAQSFAPNMFGDVLGSRSIHFTYRANAIASFPTFGTTIMGDGSQGLLVRPNAGGTIQFSDSTGQRGAVNVSQATSANLDYTQALLPNGSIDTIYARAVLESLLSRAGLSAAQIAQFDRLTAAQKAQVLQNSSQINAAITRTLNGITIPQVSVLSVSAQQAGANLIYNLAVQADANAAFPGGSTLVGRVKMSEDTSPLPRDRIIFSYDHFDNVPLTTFGTTVNRYQAGIEKTFLDGRWSFEFRIPFASTMGSTSVQGFEGGNTEFGNLRFALKRIISQNDLITFTHGVAVTLPTAADQVALSALDGSELYRFHNQQVTVEPFVAALYTPSERLFGQTWASVNFDVSGGNLTWNPAVFGGSGSQKIYDVPFLSVDQQIGYWLIRKNSGTLRGLAPFVELHWNYAIAQDRLVNAVNDNTQSNALSVSAVATHELNLIAGALMQFGNNLNVSVGASAPLLQRPDRTFDAQVGVRASYLFGRTARAYNPIYSIGTY